MDTTGLSFPSVAPLTDDELRNAPESRLGQRLQELHANLRTSVALTIAAAWNSLCYAVAMGQIFDEAFRRHDGEFAAWLKCAVAEDAEGRQSLSEKTALRYRTLWQKRDLIFPADGSEPTCRTLQDAYIKIGILPAPKPSELPPSTPPAFRLTWSPPTVAVENWSPAERTAFLTKAEPIVELYEKARAIARAAA